MELQRDPALHFADESSRSDCPVEWWFVQGHFAGEKTGRARFMVSLFRHALEWSGMSAGNAYSLLISVLDESSGLTRWLSQVDPATIPFLITALRIAPPAGFDPIAVSAFTDEIAEYGLPQTIRTLTPGAAIEAAPFRARWGDFELSQTSDSFALNFSEPQTARRFSLRLTPTRPRFHLSDVEVTNGGAMDYVSYTRLVLEGDVDGEVVRGEAWLDHQWGSQGWFVSGKNAEQIFGWDWLGIQIEDGGELLVMIIRDQRSSRALCQYAVAVEESGEARLFRDITIEPRAWWTSPVTHACYPVACRVAIPALELCLDFEPLTRDQEIPVSPPIRAVWEGAGSVIGFRGRQPIRGFARLELHGYAYFLDLEQQLDQASTRIRSDIESFLPREVSRDDLSRIAGPAHGEYDAEAQTEVLAKPLWDFIDRSGNPWQVLFPMLILGALGTESAPYSSLISVTAQMLHDGASLIDDIEDSSPLRRGQDCIHLRYGIEVAINAGSTACVLPMALLRDHPHLTDAQRLELFRILTRFYMRVHLGQGQDIQWSRSLTPEKLRHWMNDGIEEKIIQLYTLKSSSMVEMAAEGACVIAQADEATTRACCAFGRSFGIAFQILNDIMDFNPGVMRRAAESGDIAAGKLSYVVTKALRLLPNPEAARLATILCSPALRCESCVNLEAVGLVQRSGALAACRREAQEMIEREWKSFSAHVPPSEPKTMLRVLWTFLLALGNDERYAKFVPGN